MATKVLTHNLLEPLGSITTAEINIDPGDGNLVVDSSISAEKVLASGTLQYLEKNGLPTCSVIPSNGRPTLAIKATGKGQPWLRLPWAACNGATEWHIHLNRKVPEALTAHSDGGNVRLDLSGMPVTRVSADTGGGNVEVILPDPAASLSVVAKSGAGNVVIQVPGNMAARIRATTGLGKVIMDARFVKMEANTYQSPDFDSAAKKVEMELSSGAGNVVVQQALK